MPPLHALALLLLATTAAAADYHLSASGDDAAPGTEQRPWRTLARLRTCPAAPGDRIRLRGGEDFAGGILLERGGSEQAPLVIESYGQGRARIVAGDDADGILVRNAGGVRIRGLEVAGSGRTTHHGIAFVITTPDTVRAGIAVDAVEVHGFGGNGLHLGAEQAGSGFRRVRFTRVVAHDCGEAGIASHGEARGAEYAHGDVQVVGCLAYDNHGLPGKTGNHSGNGIVMGHVDGLTIERCVAHGNGDLCNFTGGGPVGIWAWESRHVLIQYNEAHHNRTGAKSVDGGGFDLDGGVVDALVQYNHSHDNDGSGILVCQYGGARPLRRAVVRFNLSEDDGRAHGHGGIHFWSQSAAELSDVLVHNNTVRVGPGEPLSSAVRIAAAVTGVRICNNHLITAGAVPAVRCDVATPGVLFAGNAYSAADGLAIAWQGKAYADLAAWRAASGQERWQDQDTGLATTGFPAARGVHAPMLPGMAPEVDAYRLAADSPLLGGGIVLPATHLPPAVVDFGARLIVNPRAIGHDSGPGR
jgi:hypothetical protein